MLRPPRRAPAPPRARSPLWLLVVAGLVFLMVVVGGITRLTESGPVDGALGADLGRDPAARTTRHWQAEFDHYKASPQYQLINSGMTLADFKAIFFWEYVHRLLGAADRPRLRLALALVLRGGARSRPAMAGSSAACSRSARCRARSAGGWSPRGWSTGPRSATSASPSICSPPC